MGSITGEASEIIDGHNDNAGGKAVVQKRNIRLELTVEPKVVDFGANFAVAAMIAIATSQ